MKTGGRRSCLRISTLCWEITGTRAATAATGDLFRSAISPVRLSSRPRRRPGPSGPGDHVNGAHDISIVVAPPVGRVPDRGSGSASWSLRRDPERCDNLGTDVLPGDAR